MLQQHADCASATTVIELIIFVAYGAYWVCLRCPNPQNSDMNSIFIVRLDVNLCDCAGKAGGGGRGGGGKKTAVITDQNTV